MKRFFFIILFMLSCLSILAQTDNVKFGIDVLQDRNFDLLEGKNVALFANFASQNTENIQTLEILSNQKNFNLKGVFVPEHGYYTTVPAGKFVPDTKINNISVYSLYNSTKKPEQGILSEIDIVVADIQDVGIRSYTYISTLYNLMEACSDADIQLLVLDRPNPMGGEVVDGNTVESEWTSFVSKIPVSYIHGCTIGELAYMINEEGWLPDGKSCSLAVIKMQGWQRWMHWEDTGVKWTPTSPHIPSVDAVRGMAVLGAFGELGIINIGIGTTLPFQYIGSPTLNAEKLSDDFESLQIRGMQLIKTQYQPFYALYSGKELSGTLLRFNNCCNLHPYSAGMEIFILLRKENPLLFDKKNIKSNSANMFRKVTGTSKIFDAFINGESDESIQNLLLEGKSEYQEIREKYLLY
jgi:uncharacterized protein YbbC (DUF1343 family)